MKRILAWIIFILSCVINEIIIALIITLSTNILLKLCGDMSNILFHIIYWPFFLALFSYIKDCAWKSAVIFSEKISNSISGTRYILLPVLMIIRSLSQLIYGLSNTIHINDLSTLILCLYLYILITGYGLKIKINK